MLEDPDLPDHVISHDFAAQSQSKAKRAVQFQRFVEGAAHGEPWATTMGASDREEVPSEEDEEEDEDDQEEEDRSTEE